MEILMGIILLLQVLMSIQLMLAHRQVLQQIMKQSENLNTILQAIQERKDGMEKRSSEDEQEEAMTPPLEMAQAEYTDGTKQKKDQEALINEVLSEVFS